MKPMLPTLRHEFPRGAQWLYEVKYDGFRALLSYGNDISMTSRNGKPLLPLFPEISSFLASKIKKLAAFSPFILDGELVSLSNKYSADFSQLQKRGRMRSQSKILEMAAKKPCRLLVFDILVHKGKDVSKKPYSQRRALLEQFFSVTELLLEPDPLAADLIQLVPQDADLDSIWENVVSSDGEGVVAKQKNSLWEEGKRTDKWIKLKNFKYVSCFVSAYVKANGYFNVSVFKEGQPVQIGTVLNGFSPEEKAALLSIIKTNMTEENRDFIFLEPAICLEVKYLEMLENQLREPYFSRFRFDLKPEDCTFERFSNSQLKLPEITHPEKPLWDNPTITKSMFIEYLYKISPYFLPFLKNRLLTVIRYPHGVGGEAFYQKNCPEYAPEYVQTYLDEGIDYIVCHDVKTLLWLGNQAAIEYHVPFQEIGSSGPDEIVFDLDPPSANTLHLAVKAALMIKTILDELGLTGFIKTSGSKGLQIYIPLPPDGFTYDETRLFTSFIADYLVSKKPELFTTERLKKKRGEKLYIDYVQHARGKTIIAPFSPRGKLQPTVAAPLFWEEVGDHLDISTFTIPTMLKRINEFGSPFTDYFASKASQPFAAVVDFLKSLKK